MITSKYILTSAEVLTVILYGFKKYYIPREVGRLVGCKNLRKKIRSSVRFIKEKDYINLSIEEGYELKELAPKLTKPGTKLILLTFPGLVKVHAEHPTEELDEYTKKEIERVVLEKKAQIANAQKNRWEPTGPLYLTPSIIAERLGNYMTAQKINKFLCGLELQRMDEDHRGNTEYRLNTLAIDLGLATAKVVSGRWRSTGEPVLQILWSEQVLTLCKWKIILDKKHARDF